MWTLSSVPIWETGAENRSVEWYYYYLTNQVKFCETLKNKNKRKSLTQRFDVAITSLSSDKDKTKNWLNIYGLIKKQK